ncbi:MAG: nucleotidyltransferase domain-containing protein [Acidimicrobiia bacterium]|nr:nucleotidyltransferase domain-containing protein [Acidimicrobiia bacterium]
MPSSVAEISEGPTALNMTVTNEWGALVANVWQLWAGPRKLEAWSSPPTYPATVIEHDLEPGARGVVRRILAATTVPLTGNKIAGLSGGAACQSGVRKAIAPLVESGLVTCALAGTATLYVLNRDQVAAAVVLAAAGARDELLARVAAAVRSWRVRPVAVWVFGSAARGQVTPSSGADVLAIRPDAVPEDDNRWETQTFALAESVLLWSENACRMLQYSEVEFSKLVATGDRLVRALSEDAVVVAGRSLRHMAKVLE